MRLWRTVATTRITFEDLPAAALAAVESHTGPVLKTEAVSQGFNSEIAARVFTESGPLFVKGLRADHKRSWTQHREAAVNPYLRGIAPALLWKIEEAGWVLLGFENLSGHHADCSPGSPDLPKTVDLLSRLGEVTCPDIELRNSEQRFASSVAAPTDLAYFSGSALLHTDLNDHNVIVDDSAYLIDVPRHILRAPSLRRGDALLARPRLDQRRARLCRRQRRPTTGLRHLPPGRRHPRRPGGTARTRSSSESQAR
jgi:hypothetical protein